jgi:hypothetical protein
LEGLRGPWQPGGEKKFLVDDRIIKTKKSQKNPEGGNQGPEDKSQPKIDIHETDSNIKEVKTETYLALNSTSFIVTLGGGSHATNADATIPGLNTTSLGQVIVTLLLANLDLLFFTTAAELIGLELVLSLELCPAVFGDVAFRHDDCSKKGSAPRKLVM